jgi:hypothetical protein
MPRFNEGDRVQSLHYINVSGLPHRAMDHYATQCAVHPGDTGTVAYISGTGFLGVRWDEPRSGMHNNVNDGISVQPPNAYNVYSDCLVPYEGARKYAIKRKGRFNKFVDLVEKAL